MYRRFINYADKNSLNFKLRQARIRLFRELIERLPRPVRILDVGGSVFYWEHFFFSLPGIVRTDYRITITNVSSQQLSNTADTDNYYRYVVADARDMPQFGERSFDVVHSNSVIEHVGDFEDQMKMAREIERIGIHHFVQTPNFWFPIEPHFRSFGWQWLPRRIQIMLVQRRKYGSFPVAKTPKEAAEIVDSAQLRTYAEVRRLFPKSAIIRERFLGFTKSFMALR